MFSVPLENYPTFHFDPDMFQPPLFGKYFSEITYHNKTLGSSEGGGGGPISNVVGIICLPCNQNRLKSGG